MWKFIDAFGNFFVNFFTALKFAAYDYDVTLQRTKTPRQRIIIWVLIFTAAILLVFLSLMYIKKTVVRFSEIRLQENSESEMVK